MWHPNYPPPNLVQPTNFPYFCNPPPSNVQPNYSHHVENQWSYSASPSVPFHSGPPPSASFQNLEIPTSTIENSCSQQAPGSNEKNLYKPASGIPTDDDYEKFIDHCKSLKYNINVDKIRKNANSRSHSRLRHERSSRSPSTLSDSNSRSWREWESKPYRLSTERSEIIGTTRHTAADSSSKDNLLPGRKKSKQDANSRSQSGSVHKRSRSSDKLDKNGLKFPKSSDDFRERKNVNIANKNLSRPTVTKEEALDCLRQLHEREFSEYKRKQETHPLYAIEKNRWDDHMKKKGFDLRHLAVEKEWKKYFAIVLEQNLIDTWNEKEEKFYKKFGSRSIPEEEELCNSKSFSTSNLSLNDRQEIYSERMQQESSLLYSKDDNEPAVFSEEMPRGKIRMREEENKSLNNKIRTIEGRTANNKYKKSTKDETGNSEKSRTRTSKDRVRKSREKRTRRSQENQTRRSQVNRTRRSQEDRTRSQEDRTRSQEDRTRKSQENRSRRSQENRTRRSQENRTRRSQENRTRRSQENRTRRSQENRTRRSQENRTRRSQENKARSSREDKTRSQENRTRRSQENRTRRSQENIARSSREDKTRSQEDRTRSLKNRTRSLEDNTERSNENRTRTQDRRKSQKDETRRTQEGRRKSQDDKTRSEIGKTRTLKKSKSQTLRNVSSLVNPHSETSEKIVQSSHKNKSRESSKQKASNEKSEKLISKERKFANSEKTSGKIKDSQAHQHLSINRKSVEKHNISREIISPKKTRISNNDSTLATKSVQSTSLENRISLKSDNSGNNSVKKDSIKSRLSFETGNEATNWKSAAKSTVKDRLYIPWQDTEKSQLQKTESTSQKLESPEITTTNDRMRRTTEKSSISDRISTEGRRSKKDITRKLEDSINKKSEKERTRQSEIDEAILFSDIQNLVIVSKSETPNGENCRRVSLKRKNSPEPATSSKLMKNPELIKINFPSEDQLIDENESNENYFPDKSQEILNRAELIKVPLLTSSAKDELLSIDDFNIQAEEQGNLSKNELNKELKEELANYSPHLNLFYVLSQMKDKFDSFSEPLSNLYNMMLKNHNERRNLFDCIDNDSEMLLILIKDKLTDFISNKTVSIIQQAIYLETLTSLDLFLSDLKEHREKIQSKGILDEVDIKYIAKAVRGKDCLHIINFIIEILTYQQIKFTKPDIMTLYMSVKKYQTSTEFENNLLKDVTLETKIDTTSCKRETTLATIVKSPKSIIKSSPKVLQGKVDRNCPETINTGLSATKPVNQKSAIFSNDQSIPLKISVPISETPPKSKLDKTFSMKITKNPVSVANVNVLSNEISVPIPSDKKKDSTDNALRNKIRKFTEFNNMSEDEKLKIYSSFQEHDSSTQKILREYAVHISKTNPRIYITVCKLIKK